MDPLFAGSEEDSERDVDGLEVSGTGGGWDHHGLGANLESLNLVDDRQPEMHAFTVDTWAQASGGVHDKRTFTSINHEGELGKYDTGADQSCTDPLHSSESFLHFRLF